jgi:hypothetical protein
MALFANSGICSSKKSSSLSVFKCYSFLNI